jgi:SAM-dependent methyltransferase
MQVSAGWQFAVEVHPLNWCFPADHAWVAGWIQPAVGQLVTDVRARLHNRVILGLSGLPHPAFAVKSREYPRSTGPGFSFLFTPQPGATLLRLEVRDRSGLWTEFFRAIISAAPDAPTPTAAPNLSQSLSRLVTVLLKQRTHPHRRSWSDLADDLLAGFVAEPLNAHPNPPFIGALEEPHAIGRRRNGCIPMTGWLAHRTAKITRILAVIDSLPVMILPHGLARQDITRVFPALGDRADLAFVGEIPLPADFAEPVLLKLFAELDNGETHLVFSRRFIVQPHGDTGQMPPFVLGLTFARAIWALHRSAGRLALPRHSLIRAARALWVRYKAIPSYRSKQYPPSFHADGGPPRRVPTGMHSPPSNVPTSTISELPSSTIIAPADDMRVPDASQYFHIGREALKRVQEANELAGGKRIEAILDLPCGYGRVTRWLRTAYPAARLTVCDIQGAGVAFCVKHLGATGVQATADGGHWEALPGPYDIIWCGSLLTHFDRDQWSNHLRRFAERLTVHGVLVFTSHGMLVLDRLQSGEADYGLPQAEVARLCAATLAAGFGYAGYPDAVTYGISVAQPGWICELIAQETVLHVIDIREAAWGQHQDVVVCTRRAAEEPAPLRSGETPPA